MTACQVFINELSTLQRHRDSWPSASWEGSGLIDLIRHGLTTLSTHSDNVLTREFYVIQINAELLIEEIPGYLHSRVQEAWSLIPHYPLLP
jgi:hypothetical protein